MGVITLSTLTSNKTATDGTTLVTASITPSANKLVLLCLVVVRGDSVSPAVPSSVTGNGLTWVFVNSLAWDPSGSAQGTSFIYRALGSSPSTGSITVTYGYTAGSSGHWVGEFSNVDTSGTNGSGAVVQSAGALFPADAANEVTVTLAAFRATTNTAFGLSGATGTSQTWTPGSGFTEVLDQVVAVDSPTMQVEWKDTAPSPAIVNAFLSTTGTQRGIIGVEIASAVPQCTVVPTYSPRVRHHFPSTATTGTWTNSPSSYTYAWYREFLQCNFTLVASGNSYRYVDLTAIPDYAVQAGDELWYAIYWAQTNSFVAADLVCSDATTFRDSVTADQLGYNCHPNADISSQCYLKWYHRKFPLTALVGKTIQNFVVASENDTGAVTGYFSGLGIWRSNALVYGIHCTRSDPTTNAMLLQNSSTTHSIVAYGDTSPGLGAAATWTPSPGYEQYGEYHHFHYVGVRGVNATGTGDEAFSLGDGPGENEIPTYRRQIIPAGLRASRY